jgi:hypothetical protein
VLGAVGLLLVVLVGAALFFLASNLDSIVRGAIERYGTEILGAKVRVASVEIALGEGRGTIRGLRVANPDGYSSADALRLGEITLQIDPGSLTASPVRVPQVRIVAPEVRYELAGRTSNLQTLLDHVNARSGRAAERGPAGAGSEAAAPRIAIASFVFEKGRVDADLGTPGFGETGVELPAVRLQSIGGRDGATPDEIGQVVMRAFLGSATRAVVRRQADRLIDEQVGGEVGEAARGLLRRALE